MKIIKTDTIWSGKVVLKNNVQVAPGVTLTIAEGARVITPVKYHGERTLEVAGTLNVHGSEGAWAVLRDLTIRDLDVEANSPAISIDHAIIQGGSLQLGSLSQGYSVSLTDSVFEGLTQSFIINPTEGLVQGNVLRGSSLSLSIYSGHFEVIENSFIGGSQLGIGDNFYDNLAISGNTFIADNRNSIVLSAGSSPYGDVDATGNWFGKTSEHAIAKAIFDSGDDLSRGTVDFSNWLLHADGDAPIVGSKGKNVFNGRPTADTYFGEGGSDVVNGKNGRDYLNGGDGADTLSGGDQADTLIGESGADILRGGAGADTFIFEVASHSNVRAPDRILDFGHGKDKLDFSHFKLSTFDTFPEVVRFSKAEGLDRESKPNTAEIHWERDVIDGKNVTHVAVFWNDEQLSLLELNGHHKITSADPLIYPSSVRPLCAIPVDTPLKW